MKRKAEFYYSLSLTASFAAVLGASEGMKIAPWIIFTVSALALLQGIFAHKPKGSQ